VSGKLFLDGRSGDAISDPLAWEAIPPPGRDGAQGEEVTKTPGEFEPPKPMTKAQREARMAFRQVDAKKAMNEHEIAQKAFSANRERLKADRLAREAGLKAKGK
jgi:hypothetical protein